MFDASKRSVPVNLEGNLLGLSIDQLHTRGVDRLRKFVRERYIDCKVDVDAARHAVDTQCIAVALAGQTSRMAIKTLSAQSKTQAKTASKTEAKSASGVSAASKTTAKAEQKN